MSGELRLDGWQLANLLDAIDTEEMPSLAEFKAGLEVVWERIGNNHYTVGVDFSNYKLIKTKEVNKSD